MSTTYDEEDEFDPVDNDYYEREVLPKIERQRMREMAKCQHNQFHVVCSTCKHIIASELNDPYGALERHRKSHEKDEKKI